MLLRSVCTALAAFFTLTAPCSAQSDRDLPRLLQGDIDPEIYDLVALRFRPNPAGFLLLKTQVKDQLLQVFWSAGRSQKVDVNQWLSLGRLNSWIQFVDECKTKAQCAEGVKNLRRQLKEFRSKRERIARGGLSIDDDRLIYSSQAPVLETALARDSVARELLARSVRAELEPPEDLVGFIEYERGKFATENIVWAKKTLDRIGWPNFSDAQLGLSTPEAWSPDVQKIMSGRIERAKDLNRLKVDLVLWRMFREIPDLNFKQRVLALAFPFARDGRTSTLFYSTVSDQVALDLRGAQIYGTKGHCNGNKEYELYPIRDADSVDARRAELGLPKLADVLPEQMRMAGPCL